MRILLALLGVLWIIVGVLLFIFPDASKGVLRNLLKQKNMKSLSILSLLIGVTLIFGSSVVSVPWFTVVLGVGSLLKGLFYLLGPAKKTKGLIDWWLNASSGLCRSWGVVAFLVGVILLLIL